MIFVESFQQSHTFERSTRFTRTSFNHRRLLQSFARQSIWTMKIYDTIRHYNKLLLSLLIFLMYRSFSRNSFEHSEKKKKTTNSCYNNHWRRAYILTATVVRITRKRMSDAMVDWFRSYIYNHSEFLRWLYLPTGRIPMQHNVSNSKKKEENKNAFIPKTISPNGYTINIIC